MTNSEQKSNEPQIQNKSRRDFLRNSAYVAAGAVAMGMTAGSGTVQAEAGKAAAKKSGGINLIAPTFEESPTYLATY